MASDKTKAFLKECREQILKFSGPFDDFTEEAAAELDRYLTEEQVQIEDRSRTREEWSRVASFKTPFFQRLALIGAYAKEAALVRMRAAANVGQSSAELTALHLEDLQEAEPLVQKISLSPGCTPDPDGGG